MANSDINTVKLSFGLSCFKIFLLVQNCIDCNGGFSGLSITDDKFSLSSADGHQTVDGFKTGLHGLVDRLSRNDTGGFDFNSVSLRALDWSHTIDGVTEGIEYSAQHFVTNGDIHNGSSSSYYISFLNFPIVTEDDNTDVVRFEIQGHTSDTRGELHHFSCLYFLKTEDSGDTVSDGDNCTIFLDIVSLCDLTDLLLKSYGGFADGQFLT